MVPDKNIQKNIVSEVEKLIKKSNLDTTSSIQSKINEVVYKLYGLNVQERKVIEDNLNS